MNELTPAPVLLCANCQAPLEGKFCHECGQSVKSVLRPMHSMVEDTLDMVFHVDERIVHTLPPLFLKPGYLSLEYFAGRRVRYVAPFRLMFVICLLALFAVHLSLGDMIKGSAGTSGFARDHTIAEVDAHLKATEAELDEAGANPETPGVAKGLAKARRLTVEAAARRRHEIDPTLPPVAETAPNADAAPASTTAGETDGPRLVGPFASEGNQRRVRNVWSNFKALGSADAAARERFISGVFSVLPQTMFVLLPVFALLLKLVYLFRRRLYMEHIIVSLHSHAFLFMSVLLLALLAMLKSLVTPHAAWAGATVGWLSAAVWIWMPVYLLLTQKRVYRQGWGMTIFKYLFTGFFYSWLLFFALLIAVAISLSH